MPRSAWTCPCKSSLSTNTRVDLLSKLYQAKRMLLAIVSPPPVTNTSSRCFRSCSASCCRCTMNKNAITTWDMEKGSTHTHTVLQSTRTRRGCCSCGHGSATLGLHCLGQTIPGRLLGSITLALRLQRILLRVHQRANLITTQRSEVSCISLH